MRQNVYRLVDFSNDHWKFYGELNVTSCLAEDLMEMTNFNSDDINGVYTEFCRKNISE